jgi:hypothetical protein
MKAREPISNETFHAHRKEKKKLNKAIKRVQKAGLIVSRPLNKNT